MIASPPASFRNEEEIASPQMTHRNDEEIALAAVVGNDGEIEAVSKVRIDFFELII